MFGTRSDNGYSEVAKGIKIKTVVYGKETLMTEFVMQENAELMEHKHVHEQTGYLIKGKMRLYIDGKSRIMNPGDSWSVPSNSVHKADILEDSIAVEVFSPFRDEYMKYVYNYDIEA